MTKERFEELNPANQFWIHQPSYSEESKHDLAQRVNVSYP